MTRFTYMTLAGVAVLAFSPIAYANDAVVSDFDNMPAEGPVNVTGTVSDVHSSTEFTIQDMDEKDINVESQTDISVKEGDAVAVRGTVERGFLSLSKKIEADEVQMVDELPSTLNEEVKPQEPLLESEKLQNPQEPKSERELNDKELIDHDIQENLQEPLDEEEVEKMNRSSLQ